MKKFVSLLSTACICLSVGAIFTACEQTDTTVTVTEEEWRTAFSLNSFSNVTVNGVTSQGTAWEATSHAQICTDGSYLDTTENGVDDSNLYYQIENGNYYVFSIDSDGKWRRSTTEEYQGIDQDDFASSFFIDLSNDYENFSYDDKIKGYVDSDCLWNGYTFNAAVKFTEGKVSQIMMESDYANMSINYSNYGTTIISYPENYEING